MALSLANHGARAQAVPLPEQGTSGEAPVDLTGAGVVGQPTPHPRAPARPGYAPAPPDARFVEPDDDGDDELSETDEGAPHGGVQRNLGLGPRVGGAWAFGAGVRAGHPYVGVDFSGGWQPLIPTVTPAGSENGESTLIHSWQLSLLARVAFNPDSSFVAGLLGGYSYNSVLGRGGVLVFDGVADITDHLGFHFHAGVGIYPDADERMRRDADIPQAATSARQPFRPPSGLG